MNERIRELEIEAIAYADSKVPAMDRYNDIYHSIVRGKFAELIVRECASLMESEKDYYSKPGSYESREYYERMAAKEDAFDDAAHMIKSHFGVE